MKLLLAVDTITTSNILLDYIESRTWPKGTEAHVLSVVEDDTIPLETWRSKGHGMAAVRHEMRRRGEQLSALLIERLRVLGIPARVTVMRGDPAFLIPFAATDWNSDLVLVRAHNRVDFRNWVLGSVAKAVVNDAPCSVELVRSQKSLHADAGRNTRILLVADGSDGSLAAGQALAQMEPPDGSEVKVVTVINPITYSLEEIGLSRGQKSERAHRDIAKTMNLLRRASFEVTGVVIAGRKIRQILKSAKDWEADLIVVGTEARSGLKRLFSADAAAAIANNAHCSVRVVRRPLLENKELPRRRKVGSLRNAA